MHGLAGVGTPGSKIMNRLGLLALGWRAFDLDRLVNHQVSPAAPRPFDQAGDDSFNPRRFVVYYEYRRVIVAAASANSVASSRFERLKNMANIQNQSHA